MQCLLDASYENVTATALAAAAFFLAYQLTFRTVNRGKGTPLTATVVFMAIAANSLVPMLGTTLEGHALVYSLQTPVTTFAHRLLAAIPLLLANLVAARVRLLQRPLGVAMDVMRVRELLSQKQIWILAAIGYLTLVLRQSIGHRLPIEALKLLEGLNFLPFMLFVLLIPPYFKKTIQQPGLLIVVGIGWAAYAGMGITSRMALVAPAAVVGFGWLFAFLAGKVQIRTQWLSWGVFLFPFALLGVGQMALLSDAIVIERQHRAERTWQENVAATYDTFMDAEKIRNYKDWLAQEMDKLGPDTWREDYISNPFLSRFTTIKFDDNLLSGFDRLDESSRDIIREKTLDKLVVQLPGPVVLFFRPELDKLEVNSYTMGDLMSSLQGIGFLGGFRTGSLIAHCVATLSWVYPIVLFVLYFCIFTLYQTLATQSSNKHLPQIGYTTLAIAFPFQMFLKMNIEGWHVLASVLIRDFWQLLVLYAIACYFTRSISKNPYKSNEDFNRDNLLPPETPALLPHDIGQRLE